MAKIHRFIDNFDLSKGNKFSTYAHHYVLGRIRRAIEHFNNIIRKPAHINIAGLKLFDLDENDKEFLRIISSVGPLAPRRYIQRRFREALMDFNALCIKLFTPQYVGKPQITNKTSSDKNKKSSGQSKRKTLQPKKSSGQSKRKSSQTKKTTKQKKM